jgi:alanine racemase
MVMVKAFAYGSGSIEIANVLQYHRVDYLGVAYADEGVELRRNNITLPIMVMNPTEESYGQLLAHDLEPEIYSFKMLTSLIVFLKGRSCTVHVKLDTGMHRLGFDETDIQKLSSLLKANSYIHVASIFSHMAGADEEQHDEFSKQQGERFNDWANRISSTIGYKPLYHLLNSPGILRLPQLHFNMVRLGIGLYGIDPTNLKSNLKPVATLKTIISQIRKIPKGESVGYGRKGIAVADITLATIAIGYADGFSRAFSRGRGEVLINGRRAPVVGNVCMDMTMVDITGISAAEGDEVIVFGEDLPINEVAERAGTIAYEILTNTSERVKRVFVAESM